LTAGAIAAVLLYADLRASSGVAAGGGAMARTDSLRYVSPPSEDRPVVQPDVSRHRRVDPEPEVVTPADSMAKHSGKLRSLLALAQ
jgi:hypothetical protein